VKDGVLVKSVTHNSAAEKAGIKAGDVILKIDDQPVSTTQNISKALRDARPKKTVNVIVMRQKKETTLSVTIETASIPGMPVRAWAQQD
jgi:serine protease Do